MDTLTHALLGAALGQVGFGRKLGWRATVIGVVGAELPDADFLIHSASDPLLNVELHRHFTHSFAFSPVIALVAVLPWFFRAAFKEQRLALFLCGLLACASHILLDACTSYGTQFLVPFTQHRFGWDLISIVDPLFTGALLAGLVGKAISDFRFPNWSQIGVRHGSPTDGCGPRWFSARLTWRSARCRKPGRTGRRRNWRRREAIAGTAPKSCPRWAINSSGVRSTCTRGASTVTDCGCRGSAR